jgi:hypothetical protein
MSTKLGNTIIIGATGAEYVNDFSGTYIDRSLVDKSYVDSTITASVGDYLPIAGGTMTGAINFTNTTKKIFEERDGLFITNDHASGIELGGVGPSGDYKLMVNYNGLQWWNGVGGQKSFQYQYNIDSISVRKSGTESGRLDFSNVTGPREYFLPDANGTVALTSDLDSYLPLAGGTMTGNIVIGSNKITNGTGSLNIGTASMGHLDTVTNNAMGVNSQNGKVVFQKLSLGHEGKLDFGGITDSIDWILPDKSGTVALTSDVPTVSGTTNTVPIFTGTNAIGDSIITQTGTTGVLISGGSLQLDNNLLLTGSNTYIEIPQNGWIALDGNAGGDAGIWYDSNNILAVYTNGATAVTEIATTDSSGAYVNILSRSLQLDPQSTSAISTIIPSKAGRLAYDTTVSKLMHHDGTSWDAVCPNEWQPPAVPLGSLHTDDSMFKLNGSAGIYLAFDSGSNNAARFNTILHNADISYDGSDLKLQLYWRISQGGVEGDLVGWIVSYKFGSTGVDSDSGVTTLLQQDVDVSEKERNLDFVTDLGTITGVTGANSIYASIERNSTPLVTGSDTFPGDAEIMGIRIIKV